jgi:hypothetical protein
LYDEAALGDKILPVKVVIDTETRVLRCNKDEAHDFSDQCTYVRELIPVAKCREAVGANNGVNLGLSLRLYLREKGHDKEERIQNGYCLPAKSIFGGSHAMT